MVSKSRARELARTSAGRILPKITFRQIAGDALALSGARQFPNFMNFVGLPQLQNSADLLVAGSIKSIFKQGGKSLSRAGLAQGAAIGLESFIPMISRLLSGGVAQVQTGGVAITARRVSN